MTEKNFGLPESLIQSVTEVLKGNQKNLDKNHNGKLDKQDFKMLRKEEAVVEDEQIDELKKSTMKSYVKKAEKSQDKAYDDSEHHMQKAINARKYENMIKHSKASEKAEKTFAKRTDGMERANMKLRYGRYRTEEVEFSDAELAHIETIMNSDNGVK